MRDPIEAQTNKFLDRIERNENRREEAHNQLVAEFSTAFYGNPLMPIPTPGFSDGTGYSRATLPLVSVLEDDLSTADLVSMISIVAESARRGDFVAIRLIEQLADKYADFHEEDHANNMD